MTDYQSIAKELWLARIQGKTLSSMTAPESIADAYALQQQTTKASQQQVRGYKIGATSAEIQQLLALDEPFYGPVFADYCKSANCDIAVSDAQIPRIEPEFVVSLASTLKRNGDKAVTLAEVEQAVGWIAPAFEFVGTRLDPAVADENTRGLFAIADFGANLDLVVGEPFHDWREIDLSGSPVTLSINGSEVASGHSGMSVAGNPLEIVRWLANHPDMRESGIAADYVISCGTCTPVLPVKAGDKISADYAALGTLACSVV